MKVTVEQKHIDNGVRKDCRCCPIALAIKKDFPNSVVDVHHDKVYVWANNEMYKLPPEARHFIARYDHHVKVEPFTFEMELI